MTSDRATTIDIEHVTALSERDVEQLAELLSAVVEHGASVGFLPPVELDEARAYWRRAVEAVEVILLVARQGTRIVGTVQLQNSSKRNAPHRAEVNKLLVHPRMQRRGIGRALMCQLERIASEQGRTTLHLDTREGDRSNEFYRSLGWTMAGIIPCWAESADGSLDGTVFYYKLL